MLEKNKKKLEAKKMRNEWQINPCTRIKQNKKGKGSFNRARIKDKGHRDPYPFFFLVIEFC